MLLTPFFFVALVVDFKDVFAGVNFAGEFKEFFFAYSPFVKDLLEVVFNFFGAGESFIAND